MASTLIYSSKVDIHEEWVLAGLTERYPEIVLKLFSDRIELSDKKDIAPENFEPVPYEFHNLKDAFAPHFDLVAEAARLIHRGSGWHQKEYSARLLHNAFPEFPDALSEYSKRIIAGGEVSDLKFVVKVLREYEGDARMDDVCRDLVEAIPEEDEILTEIRIAIESSGVVSGEFGFVEVYQDRRQRMEAWLTDPRAKVRGFAERFIVELDNAIAAEQKRAEDGIEAMKHTYGDDDTPEETTSDTADPSDQSNPP